MGRSVLRYLKDVSDQGIVVPTTYVFSRDPERFLTKWPEFKTAKWLNFYKGNVLHYNTFPEESDFSFIIHAAADSFDAPNWINRFDQILDGTRNILEWSSLNRKNRPRLLYISSGSVYGSLLSSMSSFVETYQGAPDVTKSESAYGNAKRAAEQLCSLFYAQGKVDPIIARCFCFVGRDLPLNAHFAIGNFIYDAIYNDKIVVASSGNSIRSYMAQNDLADWLLTILTQGKPNDIYNVGSDEPISIKSLATRIRNLLAPNKQIIFKHCKNYRDSRYIPNVRKAKKDLGLELTSVIDEEIVSIASFVNREIRIK